jgi:hypothetical protein
MIRAMIIWGALLACESALAHPAQTGWDYPKECCSGNDCHEISAQDVALNQDGSYTVVATGEVFSPPGRMPISSGPRSTRPYRWSEDEHFHRCNRDPSDASSHTFCLFVPRPGA